ncbi:uncharacterized protein LY89DRAFT_676613 [Mollisia scopiformis]|uniref:Uncharacterized protein n=1 Tax=Mollisia scopiformis TaxID=149040 RepID=A0A132BAM1_MOLSC|nr:uncharacterized protein LY89DRAFT_676613 [Mollisia scopiformis]KUJ08707.1 hypothetical protein LY89DRAFT_676613 [Mollisia scopiformis]
MSLFVPESAAWFTTIILSDNMILETERQIPSMEQNIFRNPLTLQPNHQSQTIESQEQERTRKMAKSQSQTMRVHTPTLSTASSPKTFAGLEEEEKDFEPAPALSPTPTPTRNTRPSPDLDLIPQIQPEKFIPDHVEEWVDLLSYHGFLDGTYTDDVLKTDFTHRSIVIFTSWLGEEKSDASSLSRGHVVGAALFEASFKKRISIYQLVAHLEVIADTFRKLVEKEKDVKTEEVLEEGMFPIKKIMQWCFMLLDGMIVEIKGLMKNMS